MMEARIAENKLGVVFPSGIIHRETSESFMALFDAVMAAPAPVIAVSFSQVKSLLSDGIRLLVVINDTARKSGKQFYITDLSREVKYTLQITNLLPTFAYVPTLSAIMAQCEVKESDLKPLEILTVQAVPDEPIQPEGAAPAHETEPATTPEPASEPTQEPAPSPAATPQATTEAKPEAAPAATPRPSALAADKPAAPTPRAMPEIKDTLANKRAHVTPPPPPLQLSEKDVKRIIKTHVPSRIALDIVKIVLRLGNDVFSFDDVKKRLSANESELKAHFKRLVALGTLMPVGGGMYNFGVSRPIRREINALINAFDDRSTHSKVLKLFLDAEHF